MARHLRYVAAAAGVLLSLAVTARLHAQYAPLDSTTPPASLAKLVWLRLARASLRDAIAGVAQQASVSIAFDPALAGLDRTVNFRADRVTAARALLRLLDGTGLQAMTTADGSIVLTVRPAGEERRTFLTGVVRQPDGPLGGVHLWLSGTRFEAMTDGAGRFSFGSVPAGSYVLRALRMGFAPIVRALRAEDWKIASLSGPCPCATRGRNFSATPRRRFRDVTQTRQVSVTQLAEQNGQDARSGRILDRLEFGGLGKPSAVIVGEGAVSAATKVGGAGLMSSLAT
jgi:hypothetical protein